jgi:hypothetical protein
MKNSPTITNSSVKWAAKIESLVCVGRRAVKASSTKSISRFPCVWPKAHLGAVPDVELVLSLRRIFEHRARFSASLQPSLHTLHLDSASIWVALLRSCLVAGTRTWRRLHSPFCMLGEYGGCGLVAFNQLSQALWSAWDMDRKNSVLHKRLP